MITIELFGVPRLRAGQGRLDVEAATLGDALRALAFACPALDGPVVVGRGLHAAFRLSLNGERFLDDPEAPLADGDCLLLLAADAGG
jgi:molybdopterin converting factor small subunit